MWNGRRVQMVYLAPVIDGSERTKNQDSWLDFALFLASEETRDAVRDVENEEREDTDSLFGPRLKRE